MATSKASRFAKGGRPALPDVATTNMLVCAECFEIGGLENEISDNGDPDGSLAAQIE
jgi:hypothetical protein